jgi:hypothetical protein
MDRSKTTRVPHGPGAVWAALLNMAGVMDLNIPPRPGGTLELWGRTFAGLPEQKMPAPKFPAMFSLFRQNGPKGFHIGTRYYDPVKEEREERLKRLRSEMDPGARRALEREVFSARMRHSWQRQSSDRTHLIRLVIVMGLVLTILYYLIMSFGLLEQWNG